MIVKSKDGHYFELNKQEYAQFLAQMMIHLEKQNKIEFKFCTDARYEAANMLLKAVADNKDMSYEIKEQYFKTANELITQYKNHTSIDTFDESKIDDKPIKQ